MASKTFQGLIKLFNADHISPKIKESNVMAKVTNQFDFKHDDEPLIDVRPLPSLVPEPLPLPLPPPPPSPGPPSYGLPGGPTKKE